MSYHHIKDMINMIDEPHRSACHKLYDDNVARFRDAKGSTHNHQAWEGGYHDHITEVMNICITLYPIYKMRGLNFSLSDALLIMYLHDLEKPWRHESMTKIERAFFRLLKIKEYGIVLNEQHQNALKYVEGENDDYSSKHRVMNELAAFCHIADISSSRIWHNFPNREDRLWSKLLKAKMYFLLPHEGGRIHALLPKKTNFGNSIFATTQKKAHCYWSVGLLFDEIELIEPGKEYETGVIFIAPQAFEYFKSGDELLYYEGARLVAKGRIL